MRQRSCSTTSAQRFQFVAMRTDAELARDVCSSALVSVDGMGIVWAARLFGIPVSRACGRIDLLEKCAGALRGKGIPALFSRRAAAHPRSCRPQTAGVILRSFFAAAATAISNP